MTAVWAGIDSGKRAHHCVVIDVTGRVLLSRRVANDELALLELSADSGWIVGRSSIYPFVQRPARHP